MLLRSEKFEWRPFSQLTSTTRPVTCCRKGLVLTKDRTKQSDKRLDFWVQVICRHFVGPNRAGALYFQAISCRWLYPLPIFLGQANIYTLINSSQ